MEDVGMFYGHSVYFTANWWMLCPFGMYIFWSFDIRIFSNFGILYEEKSGNPALSWSISQLKIRSIGSGTYAMFLNNLYAKKSTFLSLLNQIILRRYV
jgi:hypothetical protein